MKYKITVHTADKPGAGTDANIFLKISGSKQSTNNIHLNNYLTKDDFEAGTVSTLTVELPDLDAIDNIEIWHDGKGFASGWLLASISILDLMQNKAWYFKINKWLKTKNRHYKFTPVTAYNYKIEILTGTLPNSGTDSNVFFSFTGESFKTEFIHINKFLRDGNFRSGHSDNFNIVLPNLGRLKNVKILTDKNGLSSNWYLNRITIQTQTKTDKFSFFNWIKPDKTYTLKPDLEEYTVKVFTGDVSGAGTDANVFIVLQGSKNKTKPIKLNELVAKNAFEAGNLDIFKIVSKDLGTLQKITVWHDEKWLADGWYLNKIIVENHNKNKTWEFPCYTWLDRSEIPYRTRLELTLRKPQQRPFYAIAHMVNTPAYVEEALDMGANAIECDVTPHLQNDGTFKFKVHHGFRPDFDPDSINLVERSIAETGFEDYIFKLKELSARYPEFSLVIFDNKLSDVPKDKLNQCGAEFARLLLNLFYKSKGNASGIKSVLSTPGTKYLPFIKGAYSVIKQNQISKIGFDFSEEDIASSMKTFGRLKLANIWWGRGISSTVPKPVSNFIPQFLLAAKFRKRRGIIKKIYYWTLDDPDSMARMLVTNLDGIIVNDPVKLLKVLKKEEFKHTYRLANRKDNPFSVFKTKI